ncbi:MAG: hypothetical protein K2X32_02575 [Phycisphaerales bacterium]|nr:hypothetical protein [Phycisphaerales bacterium]
MPKIHYGELTPTEVSEVQAWSNLYWQRADSFIAGTTVSFSYTFTEPRMNSATFLPSRAVRPTLEDLGLLSESDCDQVLVFMPGTDASVLAKREALKNAMIGGTIATDYFTEPQAVARHATRIEEALEQNPLAWNYVGSKLVSQGLPLRKFKRTTSQPAVAALSFSTGTMAGINAIIDNIGNVLDNTADVTEAQAALSGGESEADAVMRVLRDDIFPNNNVTIESIDRIDMAFGIYGNVPLIYVRFSDSYILIDGVDGTVSTVFDLTSPLDGIALLERYTDYQGPSDSVRYFNKFGCVMLLAPSWKTTAPSVPAPTAAPVLPTSPPGTVPGHWNDWTCGNSLLPTGNSCLLSSDRPVHWTTASSDSLHCKGGVRLPSASRWRMPVRRNSEEAYTATNAHRAGHAWRGRRMQLHVLLQVLIDVPREAQRHS